MRWREGDEMRERAKGPQERQLSVPFVREARESRRYAPRDRVDDEDAAVLAAGRQFPATRVRYEGQAEHLHKGNGQAVEEDEARERMCVTRPAIHAIQSLAHRPTWYPGPFTIT